MYDDYEDVLDGLRAEGFVKPNISIDPDELRAYLAPFVEPARSDTFKFSRAWMREQFQRIQDPRQPGSTLVLRLNLPPSYLLIHRVWVGSIGVLCQLEAELPFRQMLTQRPARLRRSLTADRRPQLGRLRREARYHHSLSSLLSIARRCSREQRSQNTRVRPFSTAVVQVSGSSSPGAAAPQKSQVGQTLTGPRLRRR